jgi:hypothetical protein
VLPGLPKTKIRKLRRIRIVFSFETDGQEKSFAPVRGLRGPGVADESANVSPQAQGTSPYEIREACASARQESRGLGQEELGVAIVTVC